MKRDNVTLKTYFETGDYPTEAQFIDLIDSFLNIEEEDAVTGITDNGDGTYTFSLLSGGNITLNGADLPNDIPIANIAGLQAALDARNPGNFLVKDQDETTSGSISIVPDPATAQKFFSVARDATSGPSIQTSAYVSLNDGASAIFGNSSSSDGQDSHIIIRRNGDLEFNDNGSTHTVWHSGNDDGFFRNQLGTLSNLDSAISRAGTYSWGSAATNTPATYGTLITVVNGGGDYNGTNNWLNQLAFGTDNEVYFRQKVNADPFDYWGKLWKDGANTKLSVGASNRLKLQTNSGYTEIGAGNTGYSHFYTDRPNYYFNKGLVVDSGLVRSYNEDLNLNRTGSTTARIRITNGLTYFDQDTRYDEGVDARFYDTSHIRRYSHVAGFLEGSYNTVGVNSTKTNPIYTIGSSYIPLESTLGNMYGIGYSNSSASFLNSTDLGTNPAGWGLYIAADGNARIFLNATSGIGYFKNVVFASNFILNSDERLKEEIEDINIEKVAVRWRKFKMKEDRDRDQRYGVIAQELEKEHPEFVRTDDEGNKSVAYIDLLVAKNSELEARLKKLEKLIETLI